MPSREKVRWAQLKIGIVAIFALALLGVLVFLLTGDKSLFTKTATIYTYLDDSAAIEPGAPVRLNGILVGNISKIELSGETARNRIIRVRMEIDKNYLPMIPTDSVAAVASENVLGSKYINIKRGQGKTTIKPGDEITSLDTREFEELVASGYSALDSLRSILRRVDAIVSEVEVGRGSIGKLLTDDTLYTHLTGTVEEAHRLTEALNSNEGTIGKLIHDPAVYDDVQQMLARMDQIVEDLENGQGTAGKLLRDEALYDDVRSTVGELKTLVANLNAGKGTAGKLLTDDDLHNEISSVVQRLDTTLENLNSGQGTLGQLMVNPQLYESLNGATYEMHQFLKDFRKDPRKYLRIRVKLF